MRIYLAGPMRGIPEFNFPAFHKAAAQLRALGHEVFSPAERDMAAHGPDFGVGNNAGDEGLAAETQGFNLRETLAANTAWICAEAEAIVLLPGWRGSKGATAEGALGGALGLLVIYWGRGMELL